MNTKAEKTEPKNEHAMQSRFVAWCAEQALRIPGLESAFATPNGGKRNIVTATMMKAEGVVPGVPDWQWPNARGGFIGLAIEFKHGDGVPTKEQRTRIDRLQKDGWCVVLCWNWQAAARTVQGYAGMLRVQT